VGNPSPGAAAAQRPDVHIFLCCGCANLVAASREREPIESTELRHDRRREHGSRVCEAALTSRGPRRNGASQKAVAS
jgi:hypothetical protein